MTYGELERRANQLARLLRSRGVRRGDCVGLWLPRSLDAHVALLGILKSGAAYVPLDPEYPAERVSFILSDCQAKALVTTSELAFVVGQASRLSPPAISMNLASPESCGRFPLSPSEGERAGVRGKPALPPGRYREPLVVLPGFGSPAAMRAVSKSLVA